MALPAGVSTCTVTVGSAISAFGTNAAISVDVYPVYGGNAHQIVWSATGQPLVDFLETFTAAEGSVVTFAVPHVDQSGFINGTGGAVTGWSYMATITYTASSGRTQTRTVPFQVFVGQSTVDLDLVQDGSITSPTVAPAATVSSVNGQTGIVETINGVTSTITSAGALTVARLNPVDATAGPLTVTLAAASGAGRTVAVTKADASSNAVTMSIANLRGGAGSIVLRGQHESIVLHSKADGSWWPAADHKTKAYLDATYKRIDTFNVRNYGAALDGITDDRTALKNAVAAAVASIAAGAVGAVVEIPAGTLLLGSSEPAPPSGYSNLGVPIPVGLNGQLIIRGAGRQATSIKLTDAARCAFYVNQTAADQVFRNVSFEGFEVDNNNTVGRCHILIGNVPSAGTPQKNLSIDFVTIREVDTFGVAPDPDQSVTNKALIDWIGLTDNATLHYATNVTVEDCNAVDTTNGFRVCSWVSAGAQNYFYDQINFRRLKHTKGPRNGIRTETSFYICGSGYGESCEITGCVSQNIGDDAIEVGAMQKILVDNCVFDSPYIYGILFRLTHALSRPESQQVTVRDTQIRIKPDAIALVGTDGMVGRPLGWVADDPSFYFGHFTFERVTYSIEGGAYTQFARPTPYFGFEFTGPVCSVVARSCRSSVVGLDFNKSLDQDLYGLFVNLAALPSSVSDGVTSRQTCTIRDHEIVLRDITKSGSGNFFYRGLVPAGVRGRIMVDGLHTVRQNAAFSSLALASPGYNAGNPERITLRHLTGTTFGTGGASMRGVTVATTGSYGGLRIAGCDFSKWANAQGRDIDLTALGTTNAAIAATISEADNEYFSDAGYKRISGAYTMSRLTTSIGISSISTAFTVTLPAAQIVRPGVVYTIKDEAGSAATNNVTVAAAGSDQIEGAASKVISTNYGSLKVYSTGSAWRIAA